MQLPGANGLLRRTMLTFCVGSIACVIFIAVSAPFSSSRGLHRSGTAAGLWSDGPWQQASGYALLAACAATLLLSARKRLRRFSGGRLAPWRMRHAATGLMAALLFVAHTGLKFGKHLNSALALTFLAVVIAGAVTGITTRRDQRNADSAPAWAAWPAFTHVLLFWLLTVLTAFHVMAVYYF